MKIVAALVRHETNTFSPIQTKLESFNDGYGNVSPLFGQEAYDAAKNTASGIAAYIDYAVRVNAQIVVPVVANAAPSGIVERAAFETLAGAIVDAVAEGCDIVLLDLHGAMVVDGIPDADGELLKRIRAAAPGIPIGVALDPHANLSPVASDYVDAISAYRTYPHTDMYETGERVVNMIHNIVSNNIQTAVLTAKVPMLSHMARQRPTEHPMSELMSLAADFESQEYVQDVSVYGGFPLADVHHAGFSFSIVIAQGHEAIGRAALDTLADKAWELRHDFIEPLEDFHQTLDNLPVPSGRPVLLVDHGDNCGAGGSTSNMTILQCLIDKGYKNVMAGPFFDPEAVSILSGYQPGDKVSLTFGGSNGHGGGASDTSSISAEVQLLGITNGEFVVTASMNKGMLQSLGPTAVILIDDVRVVLCSRRQEPYDLGVFTHCGLEPASASYVLIKSRVHFRAAFEKITNDIVMVAGPGVCTSNFHSLNYSDVIRPIYPLDDI